MVGQRNLSQAREKGRRSGAIARSKALLLPFLCLVIWLHACAKAPVTGRSQLILISPQQEQALGIKAAHEILEKEKIDHDPGLNAMLHRVGERIARAAHRPDFKWEFYLIDKDVVNAFCLPGGKVFVYKGILKYTKDECGLATVVGHEVAHALARHGAERMSIALISEIGEKALEAALSSQGPTTVNAFKTVYGLASQVGVILPYSRAQEFEADHIGLILMARAGYDPRCALRFWEGMEKAGGNKPHPPVFLSTHPTDQARIQRIRKLLPDALAIYQAASRGEEVDSGG